MSFLKGKRAVVTGASAGIGEAIARELAREGAHLVLAARRKDKLEALAAELTKAHGVEVACVASDLQDPKAPAALLEAATAGGKTVEVLVNNAGFGLFGALTDLPLARQLEMLQLNVCSLVELTHRFVAHMKAHGKESRVLNVGSVAGFQPCPDFAVYGATKAFVRDFSEAIAFELSEARTAIRVTCLCPGGTTSEFHRVAGGKEGKGAAGTFMTPDTVARIGVRAMVKGKRVVIPGVVNSVGAFLSGLAPRRLVTWAAYQTVKQAL